MAVRVTAAEVKEIMDNCTLSDTIVEVYINAASKLINNVLGSSPDDDSSNVVDSDDYKEIERWFTAHMIVSTRFRMGEEEKVGEAAIKYIGKFGMGLDSTPYGQMVKQLDTSGLLAKLGKQAASIYAVKSFE